MYLNKLWKIMVSDEEKENWWNLQELRNLYC